MKKQKAVCVDWIDAASRRGWIDGDEDFGTLQCRALGFLVKESKTTLTVSASMSECNAFSDPLTIPKSCIVRRRVVKL